MSSSALHHIHLIFVNHKSFIKLFTESIFLRVESSQMNSTSLLVIARGKLGNHHQVHISSTFQ